VIYFHVESCMYTYYDFLIDTVLFLRIKAFMCNNTMQLYRIP